MEENLETIEIEVDAELLRQVEELIQPMGINMEQLIQMFFASVIILGTILFCGVGRGCIFRDYPKIH